jgi:hypothetical protein
VETTTGREIVDLPFASVQDALVSDDGKTLITVESDPAGGQGFVMTCWDLPLRAPWLWVYGPPAAALVVGLLVFKFWRRAPLAA